MSGKKYIVAKRVLLYLCICSEQERQKERIVGVLEPIEQWYATAMDHFGDFNYVLHTTDKVGGPSVTLIEVKDFQECIRSCKLEEMKRYGQTYTWNDKRTTSRIFSKIDWSFINGIG